MTDIVACGEFVKRQTKESGYSYFDGSWELLEFLVDYEFQNHQESIHPGYRDGVVIIDVIPCNFYSGIVELDESSMLTASYAPRREGEDSFIRVSTKAKKQPAKHASVVLYHKNVLAENNERTTDAEWEIVCIKARVTEDEEPMDPYTMARNFLHMKGGTKGDFTAEEFAKSIIYWNTHTICSGNRSWWGWLKSKIREFIRGWTSVS